MGVPASRLSVAPPTTICALDPSVHCLIYDTGLGNKCTNPGIYVKAFTHSWDPEYFRAGGYDLSSCTPATIDQDNKPKSLPTYAPVAGPGGIPKGNKNTRTLSTEIVREGGKVINYPRRLLVASRHLFTRSNDP